MTQRERTTADAKLSNRAFPRAFAHRRRAGMLSSYSAA
jgi:hypothetical protein